MTKLIHDENIIKTPKKVLKAFSHLANVTQIAKVFCIPSFDIFFKVSSVVIGNEVNDSEF